MTGGKVREEWLESDPKRGWEGGGTLVERILEDVVGPKCLDPRIVGSHGRGLSR